MLTKRNAIIKQKIYYNDLLSDLEHPRRLIYEISDSSLIVGERTDTIYYSLRIKMRQRASQELILIFFHKAAD